MRPWKEKSSHIGRGVIHRTKNIPVTDWRLKSSKHSFLSYEYGYQATNFHINYIRHNTTHSCKAPPIAPPSSGGRPPRLGDHFYLDSSAVSQKRDHCTYISLGVVCRAKLSGLKSTVLQLSLACPQTDWKLYYPPVFSLAYLRHVGSTSLQYRVSFGVGIGIIHVL